VMESVLREESDQKLPMKEIEDAVLSIVSKAFAMPKEVLQRDYAMTTYQAATLTTKGWKMPYTMRDILKMDIDELIRIGVTRDLVNIWMLRCMCSIAGLSFGYFSSGAQSVFKCPEKIEQVLYELRSNRMLSNVDPYEATVEELCALRDKFAA